MSDDKLDILGNSIRAGDVIAYGVRRGNSGYTHLGVITDPQLLKVVPLMKERYDKEWRQVKVAVLHGLGKVVVLHPETIQDPQLQQLILEIKKKRIQPLSSTD